MIDDSQNTVCVNNQMDKEVRAKKRRYRMRNVSYFPILRRIRKEWESLDVLPDDVVEAVCPIVRFFPDDIVEWKSGHQSQNHPESWCEKATSHRIALLMPASEWAAAQNRILRLKSHLQIVGGAYASEVRTCTPYLRDIHSRFDSGAIVSISFDDLLNERTISDLQRICDLVPTAVVLELGHWQRSRGELATMIDQGVKRLSNTSAAQIAVAAGSYPQNNAGLLEGNATPIERCEWLVYCDHHRILGYTFSDYGPVCYETLGGGRNSSTVTPAIRYTLEDSHLVLRGKKCDWSQFRDNMRQLTSELINSEFYCGNQFSWGDDAFFKIATEKTVEEIPSGHAAVRHYEWNHHIVLTARGVVALAEQPKPIAVPPLTGGP